MSQTKNFRPLPSPLQPDTKLLRNEAAQALTENGFPTATATLAGLACRGGGPQFRKYGRRVVYVWGPLLEWAERRLSSPWPNTSAADAERAVGTGRRPGRPRKELADAAAMSVDADAAAVVAEISPTNTL
jgi:hypothetical protein